MKELSFLMFMIGLIFGLSVFVRRLTSPYHPDRAVFGIPSRTTFNLLWGSIFYIAYGLLVYHHHGLRLTLGIIDGLLLGYTLFLLLLQHFILSPRMPVIKPLQNFLNRKISGQEKMDSLLPAYTRSRALSVLGLPRYTDNDDPAVQLRLEALKSAQKSGKITNSYLNEIIKKTAAALASK